MKRAFSLLLSAVILLSATAGLDLTAFAETQSGTCGTSATWSYDTDTGVLTISGSGETSNYLQSTVPWYDYRSSITAVNISDDITSIGNRLFYKCTSLSSITLGANIARIGTAAFYGCSSLISITIMNSDCSIASASSTIPSTATIYGHSDSNAETYASDYTKTFSAVHFYDSGTVTAPTCTAQGYTTYVCTICNNKTVSNYTTATGHNYVQTVKKATLSSNGSIVYTCSSCKTSYSKSIKSISSVTLSKTSYTYNGKAKKPSVTVKDSSGKVISSSNYTVTYSKGRKNVGKYKVTVKFKGNYSGTKTLYFTVKPKATKFTSIKIYSDEVFIKWKKQTKQVTGYEIQISTSKKFPSSKSQKVKDPDPKRNYARISGAGLVKNKKFYIRIRTYKTVGSKTYYSSWSKAKAVTV